MYLIGRGRFARETYPQARGAGTGSSLQTQSSNAAATTLSTTAVDLCSPLTFVVAAGTKLIIMASGWLTSGAESMIADISFQVDTVQVDILTADVQQTGVNSRVPWAMVWETPPLAAGSHTVNLIGSADSINAGNSENNSLVVMATTG